MRLVVLALVAVTFAALVGAAAMRSRAADCGADLPAGGSEAAAQRIAEACARAAYETERPDELDGWLQLAPLIRNDHGYLEYATFVWLDAPDTAPAAYELLLELRGDRWVVSVLRRAPGSAAVVAANSPT